MKNVMSDRSVTAMGGGLSRRRALGLLAGTLGGLALGGCGVSGGGQPDVLAYAPQDFAGARISAVLRKSFVSQVNDATAEQGAIWADSANAAVDFTFLDDWRERYEEVAVLRRGEDIAELFGTAPHLFADRLVDVSAIVEELGDAFGGWLPAARAAAMVDGVWRAVPWAYTAHAINYRPSVLEAAGVQVPETYDQLLEVATALHDADLPLAGFSMSDSGPNDSANLAYSILWSFGGHEVDGQTGRVALDSMGTREALRFFRQLNDVTHPNARAFAEGENNSSFLNGDISITQNASSIFWRARQEYPEVAADMSHARYPAGPNGSHQLLEMNALAIFDHSRNKAAALDLIRHMIKPAQLQVRSETSLAFYVPPLYGFVDDPAMMWNTNAELRGIGQAAENGHLPGWPGPSGKEAGLAYQNGTIVRMFANVASGAETIDSAIRLATRELRRVYET